MNKSTITFNRFLADPALFINQQTWEGFILNHRLRLVSVCGSDFVQIQFGHKSGFLSQGKSHVSNILVRGRLVFEINNKGQIYNNGDIWEYSPDDKYQMKKVYTASVGMSVHSNFPVKIPKLQPMSKDDVDDRLDFFLKCWENMPKIKVRKALKK